MDRAIDLSDGARSFAVTDESFQRDVLNASKPVLVDFWTEWCGPCKPLGVVLDEISVELGQRIVIAKLNAETSPRAAEQYGVRGFPTMLIFKGGQVVAMRSGAMAKSKLKEWIVSSI